MPRVMQSSMASKVGQCSICRKTVILPLHPRAIRSHSLGHMLIGDFYRRFLQHKIYKAGNGFYWESPTLPSSFGNADQHCTFPGVLDTTQKIIHSSLPSCSEDRTSYRVILCSAFSFSNSVLESHTSLESSLILLCNYIRYSCPELQIDKHRLL